MEETADYTDIQVQRENMYRMLAYLYRTEVDNAVFEYMKKIEFPEDGDRLIAEGFRQIKDFLNSPSLDHISDLAVDYARVFLGAGIVQADKAAYPYESVYTSEYKLVMQEARDDMFHALADNGLGLKKGYDIPEDHIFIQMEFMAHLADETAKAMSSEDGEKAMALLEGQKKFITDHLLNWVPEFCNDVRRFASSDFYKGVATITERFIRMDLSMVDDMLDAFAE